MLAAIKQTVTIQSQGLVEVRSPELHEGDQAEVTVLITQRADSVRGADRGTGVRSGRAVSVAELKNLAAECSTPRWDGSGAVAVTQSTVSQASLFLAALPEEVPDP